MNLLELPDKNFEVAIIKMFQYSITNLETNEMVEYLSK